MSKQKSKAKVKVTTGKSLYGGPLTYMARTKNKKSKIDKNAPGVTKVNMFRTA